MNNKKGFKHTEESKEKMRQAQFRLLENGKKTTKGYRHTEKNKIIMSEKKRGKEPWNKGKKTGQKVWNKGKKGLQIAWNKGLEGYCGGEQHYNWQGGKSYEKYSIEWTETLRRSIRERDRYTCQRCSRQQGDRAFDVHHIDGNKKNNDPENLITYCNSCHTYIERKKF